MTFETRYTTFSIPQDKLRAGSFQHEYGERGGAELNIRGYLAIIDDYFGYKVLDNNHTSFVQPDGGGLDKLLQTLAICIPPDLRVYRRTPDQRIIYDDLNLIFRDHFRAARQILDDRLLTLGVTENQLPSMTFDEETQTAISQLKEHAGYLVLLNHRAIYRIVRANNNWHDLTEEEQQDLFQSVLLSCWRSACRYDPEIGDFLTYIDSFLDPHVSELAAIVRGLKPREKTMYLDSYHEALNVLSDTVLDSSYWHELYACMAYDRKERRLMYDEPLRALLAYEQAYRGLAEDPIDRPNLRWLRPYEDLGKHLRRLRLPRLRQILDLNYPISLDMEVPIGFDNEGEQDFFEADASERVALRYDPTSAMKNELKEVIEAVLDTLPPSMAKVVVLRFGLKGNKEHTIIEVARMLGIPRGAVSGYLSKALRKLRRYDRWFLDNRLQDFLE
jgi:RNA polymerase sigma factor (sigma-70 family)